MSSPSPDSSDTPASGDAEAQTFSPSVAFLKIAAVILLVGGVATVAATPILGQVQPVRAALQALLAATGLVSMVCLRRGWAIASTYILVSGSWLVVTGIASITGGLNAPVNLAYPAIIIFVGWLIGLRAAVAGGVVTVATMFGFAAADHLQLLPPALPTGQMQRAVLMTIILCVSAAIVVVLVRAYQQQGIENLRIGRALVRRSGELERSQAELNRAQSVARVGSWVYDITAGRLQMSVEAARIMALPEGKALNLDSYLERVVAEDRDAVRAAWMAGLKGHECDSEHRLLVDGQPRRVRHRAEFEFDSGGRALRAIGIVQDITESRAAEESLRLSEERFAVAFRSSPLAASIAHVTDGRFIDANRNYERDFGWKREELIGRSSLEVGLWPNQESRSAWLNVLLRDGRVVDFETTWRHKNGSLHQISISAELAEMAGERCILAHVADITERKRAEAELERHRHHL